MRKFGRGKKFQSLIVKLKTLFHNKQKEGKNEFQSLIVKLKT